MTGRELGPRRPVLAKLARLQRVRHDPDQDQPRSLGSPMRSSPSAPMEMEDEAVGLATRRCSPRSASTSRSRASSTSRAPFERNVKAIDAADHRGVIQGKDHGFEATSAW